MYPLAVDISVFQNPTSEPWRMPKKLISSIALHQEYRRALVYRVAYFSTLTSSILERLEKNENEKCWLICGPSYAQRLFANENHSLVTLGSNFGYLLFSLSGTQWLNLLNNSLVLLTICNKNPYVLSEWPTKEKPDISIIKSDDAYTRKFGASLTSPYCLLLLLCLWNRSVKG